ncbi:response regulator [Magnetospirillum sp. UT-4]|uniref:hybrid sensor histidine kinase/response regulator n=1 Tax=Magnetospirillum sp. UT-4 TaxID=2681467 RepID=UPI001384C1E7|nr:response regulator [Magnetospirillum sp. UT-4]CAA7615203.1 Response regulator receiver:CheW-like protein:ATP-binding region, ATPase-like:Hpt [Magnetospirillum sp. UT-4]
MDIRERLLAAFQIESREHLGAIRKLLEDWAARREGSGIAQLDEAFRRAHSLKGAARAVDLRQVEQIAHRLETLFARVRTGRCRLDGAAVTVIGRGLDTIEDWTESLAGGAPPGDGDDALAAIDAFLAEDAPQAAAPPVPVPLEILAATEPPPPEPTAPEPTAPEPTLAEPTLAEPPRVAVAADETVRVRAVHLDRLLGTSNELLTETITQRVVTEGLLEVDRRLAEIDREWRRIRKAAAAALRDLGDGERAATLDRQAEVLEEHLKVAARQARQSRRMQQRTGWSLRQLCGELQQEVRDARMVPADSVFGGFRKMVRDLARDAGKQVEVVVAGLDVEADRMVLQGLKDPVMHLLRNALAHGVEAPADRAAGGKPAAAVVALRFDVADGRLAVVVEDDGSGVDYRAIRAKAVDHGLFTEAEAAALAEQALIDIIFDPGFSTSRAVDDLSGRGMGLSVVRETVTAMNGTVEVRPRDPAGTRFRISVPLSVSTQRLFLVSCQGHTYAVPTEGIDRLHRVPAEAVRTVEGKSVVYLGDEQLPLLSLAHLLALGETAVKVSSNVVPLVVLRNGERRVGVAVDEFLSIREALVKDIGVPAAFGTMVAGGMLLEDGNVALVLNPFEIVETFRKSGTTRVLTTVEKPAERRVPVILVVDDSLTTRTLEKSILEAHGYVVRLAVDGIEALARLRAEHVDLVISDIQMPRLDGFGLLQAIKGDQALKSVPVILVTSLEAREDRERGLALGADAYVVKRKFDQKDLLETIGQIL